MDEAVNVNQDRVVLVESNAWWWMGLFDGHGELGQIVSQVAALEFSKRISALSSANQNSFQESILKANLKQIYLDVDNALPRSPNIGGSTAISILKTQYNQLVISNLGDSEAFLASFDDSGQNVRLLYETKPHKPDLPQERARIEKMGGEVENPFQPGFSARVVIPIDEFNSMALAMSRSLGDQDGKALGVIAEPDTDVLDLNTLIQKNLNYVVIAATDGLFDHVPPLEVAEHIAKSMTGLPQAAEELILESSKRWFAVDLGMYKYRDDISISIHKLTL
jgi:serine/threonine protein phosphatase PrpC